MVSFLIFAILSFNAAANSCIDTFSNLRGSEKSLPTLTSAQELQFSFSDPEGKFFFLRADADPIAGIGALYSVQVSPTFAKELNFINARPFHFLAQYLGFSYDAQNRLLIYPSPLALSARIKLWNKKNLRQFQIPFEFIGIHGGEISGIDFFSSVIRGRIPLSMNRTEQIAFTLVHIHDVFDHMIGWFLVPPEIFNFISKRGLIHEAMIEIFKSQNKGKLVSHVLGYSRFDAGAFEVATFLLREAMTSVANQAHPDSIAKASMENIIIDGFTFDRKKNLESTARRGVEHPTFNEFANFGNSVSIGQHAYIDLIAATLTSQWQYFELTKSEADALAKRVLALKSEFPDSQPIDLKTIADRHFKRLVP